MKPLTRWPWRFQVTGLCLAIAAMHPTPLGTAPVQPTDAQAPRCFHVTHYDVQLRPQLDTKTITGTAVMTLWLDDGGRDVV